ncbi:hypothetical protein EV363DRAFT_1288679 [Boletus edulis]|nr:hypothetical protein EV363DRAFT_1288679 [Boletus edulis]
MNKLKKQRPSESFTMAPAANPSNTGVMSRTMQLAVSGVKVSAAQGGHSVSGSANLQGRGTWFSAPLAAAPRTKIEQYWVVRALVAETLLSARDQHQDELAEMRGVEERKRERDIGVILHANDQRQRRLEQLMAMCLVVLLGLMAWLVLKITSDHDAKGKSSKPSHFTIPILSPFTSVVEHETGVFGTKAVTVFVLVIGIAVYASLKHRLSQWRAR